MTGIEYDGALVRQIASTLDLRAPNAAALDAIVAAIEYAPLGAELVADLATGVGKTYIAGGLLDYLQEQGVRNVVIITPGSTIQRKTVANLTPGHPKYVRGMQSRPIVITLDDVETGTVGQALRDPDKFKVFVLTVQSLLRPDTKDNRRAHRPHEMLGEALSAYLATCGDLVVIADEHHTYFGSTAKRFQAAVEQLNPTVVVGLTATPHPASEQHVIYRYPLAEAIADGYVKIPVLVARTDGKNDLRTQLADGVALLDAKHTAMRVYCDNVQQPYVRPIMFIVAEKIEEAARIRDMLAGADLFGDPDQVLLVTSDQPDEVLRQLDALEDPESKVRAVVSVSMLKEGWDVKNIYVIAAVRALESDLLTEQVLGRGLRLPFGKRTGVGMLDAVEVISHHSFRELLRDAEALLLQTLGDRAKGAAAVAVADPGVAAGALEPGEADRAADDGAQTVLFTLPGPAAAETDPAARPDPAGDGEQSVLLDPDDSADATHEVGAMGTVEARLATAAAGTEALKTVIRPRQQPGVALPLFIPRVTVRHVRDPFSLAQVSALDVEALGRKFASDNSPTLTRKAIEAHRDGGGVRIEIKDRTDDTVVASQTKIPFDTIESDLVTRLMNSNAVAATVTEMNAATQIARAFLQGAQVTEQTPWRAEHGRLASTSLVEWIGHKQSSSPTREVVEIVQVKWPEPPESTATTPATNRSKITRSSEFMRGYPYSGWTKGVYETCSFDAYSTEFRLAELLDKSGTAVRAWVRITHTVPLTISYRSGAGARTYVPDFVVIDEQGIYWIMEGKRDDEMTNDVVLAKRDAAAAWVSTVNTSGDVHETWAYLLASEAVIKNAGNWAALKAAAQTFR